MEQKIESSDSVLTQHRKESEALQKRKERRTL